MEAIKKKLAALKDEKEAAIERAEEAEQQKKEAEAKNEQVSWWGVGWVGIFLCWLFPEFSSLVNTI